jgi:DNA invertase Pin-like site-specific DNA recombinase
MLAVFAAMAEFERDMIVERTQAGKALARTKEGFTELLVGQPGGAFFAAQEQK